MFSVRAENFEFKAKFSELFKHFFAFLGIGVSFKFGEEVILPERGTERSAFYHLHVETEFSDYVDCFRKSSSFVLYDKDKSEKTVFRIDMSFP